VRDGTFCIASDGVLSRDLDMGFNWRYPVHTSFKS
jgi:hypothetical protein